MTKKTYFLFLLLSLPTTTFATAQLKVARLFGDHMVLQREKPVKIWGWADKDDKVELIFNQQKASAQADAEGKWVAELPAMPAGGPYELVVKTKKNEVKLTDILVGEVWLLSGQSNMEWRVKNSDSAKVEIARANYPNIRHFEVPHQLAFAPEKDLNSGEWKIASPTTVGGFSAVGYFFARNLVQRLGVPVGLVHSSWGGSQIETWISEKAMQQSGALNYYPATMPRNWDEDAQWQERKIIERAYGSADFDIESVDESAYLQPGYDFGQWKLRVDPVDDWDHNGLLGFRGTAYMQQDIELPAEMASQPTTLHFGQHDTQLVFYINGRKVYEKTGAQNIDISLSAGSWQSGKNSILVKVGPPRQITQRGMGFMGNQEDFSVESAKGSLPLADIFWKMIPSWQEERSYTRGPNNAGTLLYNAMIAPLIPFTIAGTLWYQGESNAWRAHQYRQTFPLLIESWRRDWEDGFPFLFVQLATFGSFQNSNEGSLWAELREAQTMALKLPKTGMVVTTDLGDPDNIHPTNKQDVGRRLALSAMKVAYGQDDIVHSGPTFNDARFGGQEAVVTFGNIGGGLMVKEKYGYLQGFEIAGRDRKFRYAPARIEGDKVVVSHPDVPEPVAVRYGWADAPIDNNLFNAEGLPAAPFRTDDWKGKTEGRKFQ